MKIPQIIHQVYEDPSGPSEGLLLLAESWKEYHPNWEYFFWNRMKIENLLNVYFPEFINLYEAFPLDIQRWDFVRYLILYKYGGLYVDMDYECLEPLDLLLSDSDCYFGLEPLKHAELHNKEYVVGNAFIASVPDHPFLKSIIEYICDNKETICLQTTTYSVLETTGPFLITQIYNEYNEKNKVRLLPSELVTPLTIFEVNDLAMGNRTKNIVEKIDRAYAIHYFMGSWKVT